MSVKIPEDLSNFSCNGCGACCEKFFLPLSPQELIDAYRYFKDRDDRLTMSFLNERKAGVHDFRIYQDIELVAPMVRLIEEVQETDDNRHGYWYTCIHYDQSKKRCGIHNIRPRMCRGFPFYGGKEPCFKKETYPKCKYRYLLKPKEKTEVDKIAYKKAKRR